jgi:F0F1-type ATP synthase assembly protein I
MITAILISLVVGFIAGALVFRRHASRAAELEAKGKSILDVLKGR